MHDVVGLLAAASGAGRRRLPVTATWSAAMARRSCSCATPQRRPSRSSKCGRTLSHSWAGGRTGSKPGRRRGWWGPAAGAASGGDSVGVAHRRRGGDRRAGDRPGRLGCCSPAGPRAGVRRGFDHRHATRWRRSSTRPHGRNEAWWEKHERSAGEDRSASSGSATWAASPPPASPHGDTGSSASTSTRDKTELIRDGQDADRRGAHRRAHRRGRRRRPPRRSRRAAAAVHDTDISLVCVGTPSAPGGGLSDRATSSRRARRSARRWPTRTAGTSSSSAARWCPGRARSS